MCVNMNSRATVLIVVSLALVGFVSATLGDDWAAFKSQHGKSYENRAMEAMRRDIFARNKQLVDQFNAEQSEEAGYKLGLNHLSDWTESELKKLTGFQFSVYPRRNSPQADKFLAEILNDSSTSVADSVDWRKVPHRVSPIKDQGPCSSGWAFAATGALEGQEVVRNATLKSKGLVSLSEQNLLDCAKKAHGCSGGNMEIAFNAIKEEGGIECACSYPYTKNNSICGFNASNSVFTDSGAAHLVPGDEQMLKETVAKFGPVSVAITVMEDFYKYHSGVYYHKGCDPDLVSHAVLVVGYGTDLKQGDYWIVKNSWAHSWGDGGYVFMARNRHNNCGIASAAIIPTF